MDFFSNISTIDESRPTLFELIAQDQLRDLLQPAIRYVLAFYAQRYPRYLLRIANSSNGLYAALMVIVESHFLKQYGGTFTENFYGLKRERSLKVHSISRTAQAAPTALKKATSLSARDRYFAVLLLVGIPYLKSKLDEMWEIYGTPGDVSSMYHRPASLEPGATLRQKIEHHTTQIFIKTYPSLNAAYYLSTLYFNVSYMFAHSNYHTVSHAVLGQRVRRLDGQDYRRIEDASAKSLTLARNSSLSPLVFFRWGFPRAISGLRYLLPMGIFFLKFLEWWQASDFAAQMSRNTSSSIELPPPQAPLLSEEATELQDEKECKICGHSVVNPTAVQTGYVFCYVCAYNWVQKRSVCPITGVKLLNGVNGLRRLMV